MNRINKSWALLLLIIGFASIIANDDGPKNAETNTSIFGIRVVPEFIKKILRHYSVKAESSDEMLPEKPNLIKSFGIKIVPSK